MSLFLFYTFHFFLSFMQALPIWIMIAQYMSTLE